MMIVSLEKIEEKVAEYFLKHSIARPPRFVLLDKKSFKEFNKSFKPHNSSESKESSHTSKVSKVHVAGAELEVLRVDRNKDLFEVVG